MPYQPSPDHILNSLPDPPEGYSYSVECVSSLVSKVWLNHHYDYVYAEGKPVRTIYCFIKGNKVHAPKNAKTSIVKSCCTLLDLYTQNCYTLVVPKVTSLTHLL